MTAELVRGQNHPLARHPSGDPGVGRHTRRGRRHARRRAGHGPRRRVGRPPRRAHAARARGAPGRPPADHRLAVDLDAVPEAVHRVNVLLALPEGAGGPARFGAVAAPFVAVTGLDGTEVASYTITGLDAESAVVALELYRRQGAWKVRAVGQGYAGGLAELLADQGLAEARAARRRHPGRPVGRAARARRGRTGAAAGTRAADGADQVRAPAAARGRRRPRPAPDATRPRRPARPPAGSRPPTGPRRGRPHARRRRRAPRRAHRLRHPRRQTAAPPPPPADRAARPARTARRGPSRVTPPAGPWRSGSTTRSGACSRTWPARVAAYRSAVDFAESRMDQELDQALSDPRSRIGGAGRRRPRGGPRQARRSWSTRPAQALDRDLAQLTAEAEVVEPALPPAFARWDNPVWHALPRPDGDARWRCAWATSTCPRAPDLRIPHAGAAAAGARAVDRQRAHRLRGRAALDADELRRLAMDTAVAHAARLLAVYPPGEFTVHVIDPAGSRRRRARPAGASPASSPGRPPPAPQGVSATSWPGSPSGSTWCRWRCAAARPTRCRPTSTRPSSC